jgi:hypothetical protein
VKACQNFPKVQKETFLWPSLVSSKESYSTYSYFEVGSSFTTIRLNWSFLDMLQRLKKVRIDQYAVCAVVIIALAMLLRIVLTALGWPATNSDESTFGLMALHIASFKDFPIFLWGSFYLGTFEAYLGAVMFHLFGVSVFTLRLGTMLEFAIFLVSMYLLASLLYTKKLALVTLLLLSIGSVMMIYTEFMAHGGYQEILCFGAVAFLLASRLAFSSDQYLSPRRQWLRMLAFGCWGLVVALGFWSDYIFLSIILMSGLLLVLFCWRELLRGAILPLLVGLVIGADPLIIYNVQAPPWRNTLAEIMFLRNNYWSVLASNPIYGHFPILAQVKGTMLFTLPMATGAPPLCIDSDWVLLGRGGSLPAFRCFDFLHGNSGLIAIALCWSIGFIVLWMISVFHELRMLWKLRLWSPGQPWSSVKRQALIRHFARLVLLGSAGLILLQYTSGPVSAVFSYSSRYLIGLLISTPALIAPLWGLAHDSHQEYSSASARYPFTVHLATVTLALRRGILLIIGGVLLLGTISVFYEIPKAQAVNQQQNALIRDLLRINATHIYTDYWTCDRLAFLTKEQIICAVVDNHLHDSRTRPPRYYSIVKADPHSAFVYPVGSAQASATAKQVAISAGHYRRFVFDGFVIYQPVDRKTP